MSANMRPTHIVPLVFILPHLTHFWQPRRVRGEKGTLYLNLLFFDNYQLTHPIAAAILRFQFYV